MNAPIFLNQLGIVCALGRTQAEVREALFSATAKGVAATERYSIGTPMHLGTVDVPAATIAALPLLHRSRNNGLIALALAEIEDDVVDCIEHYGSERVGVVLGTSTSGIGESIAAVAGLEEHGALTAGFHYSQKTLGSPALWLAAHLGVGGPAYTVSTACSSAAKALAAGARMIRLGLCDAVLAGGADSLSEFTIAGFSALDSLSIARCNPLSIHRCGINLGEGAALFLLTREPAPVYLAGSGESSDAHHISAPAPDGRGARDAMKEALRMAGLAPNQIDYINMHGTATPQNDAVEAAVMAEIFGDSVWVSSTKPLTGHALGAAGAIEAALAWLSLVENPEGLIPPHWWDGCQDPALPELRVANAGDRLGRPLSYILSNSFAFGGNNATLILGRHEDAL